MARRRGEAGTGVNDKLSRYAARWCVRAARRAVGAREIVYLSSRQCQLPVGGGVLLAIGVGEMRER